MSGDRPARVAQAIRENLADLIAREVGDPRLGAAGLVSVNHVELNQDMSVARIYVAFIGGPESATAGAIEVLQRASGHLRGPLGRRMRLARRFEETVNELYLQGRIPSTLHLAIGQEAPAVGVLQQLQPGDYLLLGVDLVKSVERLHAAYNDSAGVTAEFNRNVLRVINRELDADFEPANFEHVAFFKRDKSQIEMHLRARTAHTVRIAALDLTVAFAAGETIHTESSRKFTRDSAEAAIAAGEVDAVAFGTTFIANPDLPRRFALNAPLNAPRADKFYGGGAEGYTDYPTLSGDLVDA